MIKTDAMTDLSSNIGSLGLVFWVAVGVAVVARVVIAIVRRNRGDIKRKVVAPLIDAATVEAEISGWKSSTTDDMRLIEGPHREGTTSSSEYFGEPRTSLPVEGTPPSAI